MLARRRCPVHVRDFGIHTYIHTYIVLHTYICTYVHTYIHTYVRTYAPQCLAVTPVACKASACKGKMKTLIHTPHPHSHHTHRHRDFRTHTHLFPGGRESNQKPSLQKGRELHQYRQALQVRQDQHGIITQDIMGLNPILPLTSHTSSHHQPQIGHISRYVTCDVTSRLAHKIHCLSNCITSWDYVCYRRCMYITM